VRSPLRPASYGVEVVEMSARWFVLAMGALWALAGCVDTSESTNDGEPEEVTGTASEALGWSPSYPVPVVFDALKTHPVKRAP
jgi:hypothetical protein